MIETAVRRLALSVPAHVIAHDLVRPGEVLELIVPLPTVRHAGMDHDEWLAFAGGLTIELRAVSIYQAGSYARIKH
jgi:hypothetical protein